MNGSAAATEHEVEREVERLRDEAASLLQQAAACTDPHRCDALTRAALASIDLARRLVDAAGSVSPPKPGTSLH